MRHRFLISVLVACCTWIMNAQDFYFKPHVRYHTPLTSQESPDYFDAAIMVAAQTGYYYTYIITSVEKFSLAEGLSYGGDLGYKISRNISAGIGLEYFEKKKEFKADDVAPHYPLGNISWQIRTWNAQPSILLTNEYGKITFNMRAGFVMGLTSLGKSIIFEEKRKTFKFNSSFSYGYTFGMEIGYSFSSKIGFNLEAGVQNLFYRPRKAILKQDNFSYWDLEELPPYLSKIIYVKEVKRQPVEYDGMHDIYYTDYYKPLRRLKETLKMNSFFTGIGIVYKFSLNEKD